MIPLFDFDDFTRQLDLNTRQRPQVLGLAALGSMAEASRRDPWSDHDFFLIVQDGAQESFRQTLDWLPHADQIALAIRETAHGLKVLYDNGHLIEFAVFSPDELALARINDHALLHGDAALAERFAEMAGDAPPAPEAQQHLGMVICLVLVGAGRAARGEVLSGSAFLKHHAMLHLLALLAALLPAEAPASLDSLDPFRRFEQAYPMLSARLQALLLLPPLDCAEGMLALLEAEVAPRWADFPQAAFDAVRRRIEGANT